MSGGGQALQIRALEQGGLDIIDGLPISLLNLHIGPALFTESKLWLLPIGFVAIKLVVDALKEELQVLGVQVGLRSGLVWKPLHLTHRFSEPLGELLTLELAHAQLICFLWSLELRFNSFLGLL